MIRPKKKEETKIEDPDFYMEIIDRNAQLKECPTCKTMNNDNRVYCKKCGNNIKHITCPVCETKNDFMNKYCINCDSILQNKRG